MKFLGKFIAFIIIIAAVIMFVNGQFTFNSNGGSSSSSADDPLSEKSTIEATSKKIGVELAIPGEGILINAPQRSGTIFIDPKGTIISGDSVRVPMTKDGVIIATDPNTGEIMLDSLGNPVYVKNETLKLDDDGNALIDKDGNIIVIRTTVDTDDSSNGKTEDEIRKEVLTEIQNERAPKPDLTTDDTTSGVVFRLNSAGGISSIKDRVVFDSNNKELNSDEYVVTDDGTIVLKRTTTNSGKADDRSSTGNSVAIDADGKAVVTSNADSDTTDDETQDQEVISLSDPLRVKTTASMSLLGVPSHIYATSIVPNVALKASNVDLNLLAAGEPVTSAMSTKTIMDNWSTSSYAGAIPAVFVDSDGVRHAISVYAPVYDTNILTLSFAPSSPQDLPDKLMLASSAHENKTVSGSMPTSWQGGSLYIMLPSVRVHDACVILPYAICDSLDLYQAPFSRSTMDHSSFVGANLGEASMDRGKFNNSDFSDANLSRVDIQGSNFSNTKTSSKTVMAQISAASATLKNSDFSKVEMSRSDFDNANASNSDFTDADLYSMKGKDANFSGVDAKGAIISRATAPGIDFHNSDLRDVDFSYSDLRNANFNGADLRGANFNGADLRGASFTKAKVLGVKCPSGVTVTYGTCNWNFSK